MMPRLARWAAVLIAILAVIDPALTTRRRPVPFVAIVAADSAADGALAARVARQLAKDFHLVMAPFAGAAATVIVGKTLPRDMRDLASSAFAVLPARVRGDVALESVSAPLHASLDSRVPLTTTARVTGLRGSRVTFSLLAGGLVLDAVTKPVLGDDDTTRAALSFVPLAPGLARLRVVASVAGAEGGPGGRADVLVDVQEKKWTVLFYDPRPSWMSTFVRRTIERDTRFVVTSRIVTSRNISSDAGGPPALDDLASLALFDAVVIGAPDALGDREVSGLDAFLRQRGGGVVLLFDQRGSGPYERLTASGPWAGATETGSLEIGATGPDTSTLRASEIAWPLHLPEGAQVIAENIAGAPARPQRRPVVWRASVGAGRLVVSSALDAWQFRDVSTSGFGTFWPALLAETADASPPLLDVTSSPALLRPGQLGHIMVTARDDALANVASRSAVRASASASLESGTSAVAIRLWPTAQPGHFRGAFRAPASPGDYRISVASDAARATVMVSVADTVTRAIPDDSDLVQEWVRSHGGAATSASDLPALHAALTRAIRAEPRPEPWHPMRSPWWIVPFVTALGAEWWARRRRGLA